MFTHASQQLCNATVSDNAKLDLLADANRSEPRYSVQSEADPSKPWPIALRLQEGDRNMVLIHGSARLVIAVSYLPDVFKSVTTCRWNLATLAPTRCSAILLDVESPANIQENAVSLVWLFLQFKGVVALMINKQHTAGRPQQFEK